jgi:DNA-binding transcriptional ArsR family regulator
VTPSDAQRAASEVRRKAHAAGAAKRQAGNEVRRKALKTAAAVRQAGSEVRQANSEARAEFRELRDPRDMRALAHPIRLALLEALTLHGPLTATAAGELIGEGASTCSFHLRSLAQHGFVEETGDGRGRQRPWRRVSVGTSMAAPYDSAQAKIAAQALGDMFLDRYLARLQQARAKIDALPPEWADKQADVESIMWVTPAELEEINDAVVAIAIKHRERIDNPSLRPDGAEAIELLYFTYNASLASLNP